MDYPGTSNNVYNPESIFGSRSYYNKPSIEESEHVQTEDTFDSSSDDEAAGFKRPFSRVVGSKVRIEESEIDNEEQSIEESEHKHLQTENSFSGSNDDQTTEFKRPFSLVVGSKVRTKKTHEIDKEELQKILHKQDIDMLRTNQLKPKNNEEDITFDIQSISVPYSEPLWGGKPNEEYRLEVLKSGMILERIDLTESFYIVGRLSSCSLLCTHPSISRHHAIIQYRVREDKNNSKGFYLYDLESTHGTYWNGHRIKPRTYVRLYDGHIIKFGYSQRKYIIQAPLEDQEEESELTFTQLKEKRINELRERELKLQEEKEAEENTRKAEENEGIDWGMGEDADEETDLRENPYASMVDEELYLDDPKKTLRGWFEREGYDLQYQVEEKGVGQFLCWVNLPKECFDGRFIKAEALVKGKKKESVIQCALEACRILDKHGLLRQANHESRKRKARNWEEEDYYDSDEDNFLDRTGTVEKKREQRMKQAGKFEEKVETYGSLIEKYEKIVDKIAFFTERLKGAEKHDTKDKESEEDTLDAFMSNLNKSTLRKSDITKMKVELRNLHKEEEKLFKLINLTKPASLPPLVSQNLSNEEKNSKRQKNIPSKKQNKPDQSIAKHKDNSEETACASVLKSNYIANNEEEEEEEDDEDDEDDEDAKKKEKDRIHMEDACSTNIYKTECEKSASCKDELKLQDNSETKDKLKYTSGNANGDTERRDCDANIDSKKRRKDKKSEKSKILKGHYDEDIHSNEYSTWLPPQDQTGDGRTSLNDKYGY